MNIKYNYNDFTTSLSKMFFNDSKLIVITVPFLGIQNLNAYNNYSSI